MSIGRTRCPPAGTTATACPSTACRSRSRAIPTCSAPSTAGSTTRRACGPSRCSATGCGCKVLTSPTLVPWLRRNARAYDVVVFITYLYWPAWAGLQACGGAVPTLLHPTAHDEPPLRLSIFQEVMRAPDGFVFLTPEEADLVRERFPAAPPGEVVGIGVEMDRPGDEAAFRRRFGIGSAPYLLYVGRVDPAKGAAELIDYFVAYKERNPGDLVARAARREARRRARAFRHSRDRVRRRRNPRRRARRRAGARAPFVLRKLRDGVDGGVRAETPRARAGPQRGARRARAPEWGGRALQRLRRIRGGGRPAVGWPRAGRRDGSCRSSLRRARVPLGRRHGALRTCARRAPWASCEKSARQARLSSSPRRGGSAASGVRD